MSKRNVKFNKRNVKFKGLLFACLLFGTNAATAQPIATTRPIRAAQLTLSADTSSESAALAHYMKFAHPLGRVKLEFLGPFGGYTFIQLPTKEVIETGLPAKSEDTIVTNHLYLLDMDVSHDGTFLAPDTLKSSSDMVPFQFVLSKDRLLHAKLAPNRAKEAMLGLDSSFNGVIGYGFLRQFVSVFDFKNNTLTLYPLFANVSVGAKDDNALQLPLLDDAFLTYCHCPYPTIWLDAQAPPLEDGRVQLAFQQPISQIFTTALDARTKHELDNQVTTDPKTGVKSKVGLNLAEFKLGGTNIAARSPHRAVDELPPPFHDLSVKVLGTLGTDVLRTFTGVIIDPSRSKVILVK